MITQQRLHELFAYDAATGRLHRRVCGPGEKVVTYGRNHPGGYFVRWVDDKCYTEHRLVYLYHHGTFPKELDHINRVKTDNRIENLRPCSRSLNNGNQKPRRDNTSGYRGVTKHACGRWMAQLSFRGQHYHLGLHDDPVSAAQAYNVAALKYFGEFARVNVFVVDNVADGKSVVDMMA